MLASRRFLGQTASLIIATGLTIAAFAAPARSDAPAGQAAPTFSAQTASGAAIDLSDFAGQTVVLEWTNHDCPYVRRHYNAGHMQGLQARAADENTVWIQVISSAPGEQGHVQADQALALNTERNAVPAHVVLDPEGDLGRLYDARTTPHMYIIDGDGVVQYAGAIDDQPRPRANSPEPVDYVGLALTAVAAGETPDPAETQPYGCNVKYAY